MCSELHFQHLSHSNYIDVTELFPLRHAQYPSTSATHYNVEPTASSPLMPQLQMVLALALGFSSFFSEVSHSHPYYA